VVIALACTLPPPPENVIDALDYAVDVTVALGGCVAEVGFSLLELGLAVFTALISMVLSLGSLLLLIALLKGLAIAITNPLELPLYVFRLLELSIRFVDFVISLVYRLVHLILELIPF
jgi:hypothetical protein